ncbi:c-type cytochrome [Microbulbifer sp. JMSA008]|uniref:c-type cytochrome n=1 Tax=Microbulbifer sp. JMSA008 TaxID=3243373 RepID=UPI0040397B4C
MELVGPHRSLRLFCAPLIVALLTSGCSESNDSSPKNRLALAQQALTLAPADPEIAEIYQRTCRSCHSTGVSAAPLTGDIAGWEPRLDKGMDVLVENAINGFQGMPPLGLCFECSPEQFEQLIAFMASAE